MAEYEVQASAETKLLIVQPYIPEYRVPLFRCLSSELSGIGIQMSVAAAVPTGEQALRRDDQSANGADYLLDERLLRIGRRTIHLRNLGTLLRFQQPDFVIVEQAIKNTESWPLLIHSARGGSPRVAMWGNGRSYSERQTWTAAQLKNWLTRRADWFFAYTQAGADHVVSKGFPQRRVTVLRNSTDTRELHTHLASISQPEKASFIRKHALTDGQTAIFVGGIDAHKGIGFLLDAAKLLGTLSPGFKLLVAGAGSLEDQVKSAEDAGEPIVYLGRLTGREKALALSVSDIVMVPEWVGLVAVDALATGLPVVTTRHDSHSAEFEYLAEGQTMLIADHTVTEYALLIAELLRDPRRLSEMSSEAIKSAKSFSVELMARRFADGIGSWIKSGKASPI